MQILQTHWRSLAVALLLTVTIFPLAFVVWIVFWLGEDQFVEMGNSFWGNKS